MSHSIDSTMRDSESTIDAIDVLAKSLEREDDAILLAIGGRRSEARQSLSEERAKFDEALARLRPLLMDPDEIELDDSLRSSVREFRRLGDWIVGSGSNSTLHDYHNQVNPALRRAVTVCGQLRELHFRSMRHSALNARNAAERGTWVVAAVAFAALLLSSAVAIYLTRKVVGPVRSMTEFADSIRGGNFTRRVHVASQDELSRLAAAFNQMAEALAEMRRVDLDQVLRAKSSLEAMLAAVPDAVLLIDPRERVASLNQTAQTVFGTPIPDGVRLDYLPLSTSAVDVVRHALRGLTPPRPGADLAAAFAHCSNGETRMLLPVAAPVPHFEGDAHGAVLILYDVTDFAKLDELRMELIGVASHELRTPLTTVKMNLLLMSEESADFPQRRKLLLENAVAGVEELGKTIDELLDLTRADAGQLRLSLDRLDIALLTDQVCLRLIPRFEEAGIKFVVRKETTQTVCRGDGARLSMVLTNLLANALKYTPTEGEVIVTLSSMQNAGIAQPPNLQFAVTDSGRGIPEEFRERVFDKFFRVEHHQKTEGKETRGTGIGLYLCRHIIKAHGGEIHCEAGNGGIGTRIAFTLPGEA